MTQHEWWIGLENWVLQDGNYTDFVTGERRHFALEFGYRRERRLRKAHAAGPADARHTGHGTTYAVTAQVLRASAETMRDPYVVDFGLRAYSNWLTLDDGEAAAGDWVSGQVHLAVDPFFYTETDAHLPDVPALTYSWTVLELQLSTALGAWRTVDQTRPWAEHGDYRLRCRLESVDPLAPTAGASMTP